MKITAAKLFGEFTVTGQPETGDGMTTPPVSTSWTHSTPRQFFDLSAADAFQTFEFLGAAGAVSKVLDSFPSVELDGDPVKTDAGSFLSLSKLAGLSIQVLPKDSSAAFSGAVTIVRTGIFGTGTQVFTAKGAMFYGLEDSDDWQTVDSSTELSVSISAGANAKVVIMVAGLEADGHNYYS